jgi:NAD-dependent oxidoreductase involved in siderophore biosynthesis
MHCNLFRLLVVLVSLVVDDVEELELVDTARGGDDAEPVTELLLLEELLGPVVQGSVLYSRVYAFLNFNERSGNQRQNVQVLEVTTRELVVGNDLDLALTLLLDNDVVAKVVGAALDLDAVLEELLEGSDVEDLVAGRLRSINDVLQGVS